MTAPMPTRPTSPDPMQRTDGMADKLEVLTDELARLICDRGSPCPPHRANAERLVREIVQEATLPQLAPSDPMQTVCREFTHEFDALLNDGRCKCGQVAALPVEAERIMDWPDSWTQFGIDEKGRQYELKDSPRYQLCGNGEARAWGEWIARRLVALENGEVPHAV